MFPLSPGYSLPSSISHPRLDDVFSRCVGWNPACIRKFRILPTQFLLLLLLLRGRTEEKEPAEVRRCHTGAIHLLFWHTQTDLLRPAQSLAKSLSASCKIHTQLWTKWCLQRFEYVTEEKNIYCLLWVPSAKEKSITLDRIFTFLMRQSCLCPTLSLQAWVFSAVVPLLLQNQGTNLTKV